MKIGSIVFEKSNFFRIEKVPKTPVGYLFLSKCFGTLITIKMEHLRKKSERLLERHVAHAYPSMHFTVLKTLIKFIIQIQKHATLLI